MLVQGVETGKPRDLAEEWARELSVPAEDVMASPFTMFGEVEALVDKLYEQRERLGISYISTHGHGMDKLAPVVARLAGK